MIEHPYIGKHGYCGSIVLFTDWLTGYLLYNNGTSDKEVLEYHDGWAEEDFTNITKEYLENKCVKIESPEHSEFVQKLAFKAGYSWYGGNTNLQYTDKEYLHFWKEGDICYEDSTHKMWELTQLPMPPEAIKENPETEEWPQVGDEVSFPSGKGILVVDKPDKNGIIIVKSTDVDSIDEYKKVSLNALKKPLTPEESENEWKPAIGEKSLAPFDNREVVVTVAYFDTNSCGTDIALVFNDKKPFWVAKDDLKPLSKEHIILEEVTTLLEITKGLGTKSIAMRLVDKCKIKIGE